MSSRTASERQGDHDNAPAEDPYPAAATRRAEGKALRDAVPRADHSGWKPPEDRRDPVEVVLAANEGRMLDLVPIRHGRMLQSPFAFYRGTAAIMAADLAHTPSSGLRVQACGDAHLSNFGGFATPERELIFDVNDLDETLPAPWEWDVKRLTASVVLAGRHIQLKQSESARAALAAVRSYREHMAEYAFMKALDIWYDRIDLTPPARCVTPTKRRARDHGKESRRRAGAVWPSTISQSWPSTWARRRASRTTRRSSSIPPSRRKPRTSEELKAAWALYHESLPEHVRVLFDRFHLCDMAMKVVGVGSVGTMCMIALFMAADDDPLFLQIKEANASVLEPYAGKSLHGNHGQRVVVGQRLMQSASDMLPGVDAGTSRAPLLRAPAPRHEDLGGH